MTVINANARRIEHVITGSAVIPYNFPILDAADIEVIQAGVTLLPSMYVVAGVGLDAGGTVTLVTQPADGTLIIILGKQEQKQTSTYTVEAFPPTRIQNDFNKAVITDQQIYEILNRIMKFNKHSLIDAPALPDPTAVDTFLRVTSLAPLAVGWGTLAVLGGAIGIPVSIANGGSGATTAAAARAAFEVETALFAAIASAASLPLVAGKYFTVSGTTTITNITAHISHTASHSIMLRFLGVLTLTHSASLILEAGINAVTAAGDIYEFVFEGAGVWRETSRLVTTNVTAAFFKRADGVNAAPVFSLPRSYLAGLKLANNTVDATNDLDIAVGVANSDDNTEAMTLVTALIKRIDAAWVVGTNQGGLDTGVVADNTYHIWLIKRVDTGVVDVLFSLSATAPTMPTSYTKKRRIGSIVRITVIRQFKQYGNRFLWTAGAAALDFNAATGTTAFSVTHAVPTGGFAEPFGAVTVGAITAYYNSSLEQDDLAPSQTAVPGAIGSTSSHGQDFGPIPTNASGQSRFRFSVNVTVRIASHGWIDTRGRDD